MIRCKKVELRSTDLCTLYAEIDTLRQQLAAAREAYDDTAKAYAESIVEIERLRKIEAAAKPARALLAKFKRWNDCDDERVTHETEVEVLNEVSMEVDDVLNDLSTSLTPNGSTK